LSNEALVPLGKSFPHVFTRIVNEFFDTVPLGESGELLIGGKGIATGYFHNPTLQSERFVRDLDDSHGMMFRTGDCAKMLANGNIYFEGRNIHCININGIRIDVNSIEAVLKNHPKISQALVTINNQTGQPTLVYYLILEDETLTYEELISFLQTKFKKLSLPLNFYVVNSLGLTFNNKINRKFIPDKVLRILSPAIIE
jgi:acyl-CoA synthetase (AMP-forming)/AMP-acid ligase II